MKRVRGVDVVLIVVLALVWASIGLSRPDHTRRNRRWLPQMEDPLAFETQRGTLPGVPRRLAGARVEGTVARGFLPSPSEPASPLKADEAQLKRGSEVFAAYCAVCHGPGGLGDGPVTRRGVPAPPSLFGDNAMKMTDGKMFRVISEGQKNMAAYASQIDAADRWRVVLAVRAMQAAKRKETKR